MRALIASVLLLLFSATDIRAELLGEKVYLQTDKDLYISGETIWLKCYLANIQGISDYNESNYIYVELIKDSLVNRIKIKREERGFDGHIDLDHELSSGIYTIRAYTLWHTNHRPHYIFSKSIVIVNPMDEDTHRLFENFKFPGSERVEESVDDIKFYPEGGALLVGNNTTVIFHATGPGGSGCNLSGTLFDNNNSPIYSFTTLYEGLGQIKFTPEAGKRYYVIVNDKNGNSLKRDLPAAADRGGMIKVEKRDDRIYANIVTRGVDLENSTVEVLISDRDGIAFNERVTKESQLFIFNKSNFNEGVNCISLIVDSVAVSERPLFIFGNNGINADFFINKEEEAYDRREKVLMELKITNSKGEPVKGSFSVSVTDAYLAPLNPLSNNLSTYMELFYTIKKPQIKTPFGLLGEDLGSEESMSNNIKEVITDLILLANPQNLLTIDERRAIVSTDKPVREHTQSISGRATSIFRNTKNSILSVLSPSINLAVSEELNRSGYFKVDELNFPDSTSFVISCMGKKGEKGYYVEVMKEVFPNLTRERTTGPYYRTENHPDTEAYTQIYHNTGGERVSTLGAAYVISGAKVTPKHNPSVFISSYDRRQIREREELGMYSGMSLTDFIVSSFPGLMYGGTGDGGGRYLVSTRATNIVGERAIPKVFIDKTEVIDPGTLDYYTVDDIENVVFLKGNDGFLHGSNTGVILVTLRKTFDKGARHPNREYNTTIVAPLGWQKARQFFSPDYSKHKDRDAVVFDSRSTLYWNPSIESDGDGVLKVEFYKSDRKTRFNITVEGIDETGRFISIRR